MSREPVEIPPIKEHWWDRGQKRRPYHSQTAALSIELGPRAYRCWTVEHRDGRDLDGQLELWKGYATERERALEKRLAELDRLEAEIMAEMTDA